jgi:hypothetical protein
MPGEVIGLSDRDLKDPASETVRLLSKILEDVDILRIVLI